MSKTGNTQTLDARNGTGGNNGPLVLCVDCRHGTEDSTAQTLTGGNGGRGHSLNQQPVIHRQSAQVERDATMGSLFDGIGGFPLLWEQLNGKGSCLWASEIEPFCVAVTKRRFEK